eukprot:TRINITY_DN366_c0_g1_i3.p3 TRINITY_DN366_c0_g1~~TRINITY_DN366_c0_g1_i3.p3  ORF type:complete len:125 (-),score=11.88 TRINITY_DN366_c0_g1_i3:32-406(-)
MQSTFSLSSARISGQQKFVPVQRQIQRPLTVQRRSRVARRAIELDWSDPDTWIGLAGAVLGVVVGIGTPLFYISRDNRDDERLEELREINRTNFKETGEYLSEEEISEIRPPRWTDRREFVDDD